MLVKKKKSRNRELFIVAVVVGVLFVGGYSFMQATYFIGDAQLSIAFDDASSFGFVTASDGVTVTDSEIRGSFDPLDTTTPFRVVFDSHIGLQQSDDTFVSLLTSGDMTDLYYSREISGEDYITVYKIKLTFVFSTVATDLEKVEAIRSLSVQMTPKVSAGVDSGVEPTVKGFSVYEAPGTSGPISDVQTIGLNTISAPLFEDVYDSVQKPVYPNVYSKLTQSFDLNTGTFVLGCDIGPGVSQDGDTQRIHNTVVYIDTLLTLEVVSDRYADAKLAWMAWAVDLLPKDWTPEYFATHYGLLFLLFAGLAIILVVFLAWKVSDWSKAPGKFSY